eukprot:jgi/Ulvmu1/5344/UM022_0138.1
MQQASAPSCRLVDGTFLMSPSIRECEFEEYDGYSPIARLERSTFALHEFAPAVHRASSMWATSAEYHQLETRLGTRCSTTDLARVAKQRVAQVDCSPKRNSCSEADTTLIPEMIGESQGSMADRYRFRYDEFSPESAYSPIAGVKRCRKSSVTPSSHVFCSHVDADGAVCSQPVVGPLALVIRTTDGNELTVYVKDGMQVKHLKEKLWNMLGIKPSNQHLIMVNGGEAVDNMPFAGSGLQPFEVLFLKQS